MLVIKCKVDILVYTMPDRVSANLLPPYNPCEPVCVSGVCALRVIIETFDDFPLRNYGLGIACS